MGKVYHSHIQRSFWKRKLVVSLKKNKAFNKCEVLILCLRVSGPPLVKNVVSLFANI